MANTKKVPYERLTAVVRNNQFTFCMSSCANKKLYRLSQGDFMIPKHDDIVADLQINRVGQNQQIIVGILNRKLTTKNFLEFKNGQWCVDFEKLLKTEKTINQYLEKLPIKNFTCPDLQR